MSERQLVMFGVSVLVGIIAINLLHRRPGITLPRDWGNAWDQL